jgi:hypothetical protein
VPEDEIKNISSVLTVVDGSVVFSAGKYSNLSPKLPEPLPEWSPIKYFGGYYRGAGAVGIPEAFK